jgi:hypothetical protein
MFHSLPSDYEHLVDLDHADCPKSGSLGDALAARVRLQREGLDLAWNAAAKRFAVVHWETVRGWHQTVPTVVLHAAHGETGEALPLSEAFLTAAVYLHKGRGTVESRTKARLQAQRDQQRAEEEQGEVLIEECVKEVHDAHPGLLRNSVAVPAAIAS